MMLDKETKWFGIFKSVEDIVTEFAGYPYSWDKDKAELRGKEVSEALKDAHIHMGWYGHGSYCGSAMVVYEKDGKLFEVNGDHCSCYGLEGQWTPEETSWEAIAMRPLDLSYSSCEDEEPARRYIIQKAKEEVDKKA